MKWEVWYTVMVLAVWVAGFAYWGRWLKRKYETEALAREYDSTLGATTQSVRTKPVQHESPHTGQWMLCPDCDASGTRRVRMGTSGSFPVRCVTCGGDGVAFVYARRGEDFPRPMGVRPALTVRRVPGLARDGGERDAP